jgi:hypothetical protein
MDLDRQALKAVLKEVLQEEMAAGRFIMAPKFDGGTLVLQPGDTSLQAKEIPIDAFFKKITSVREKLRVLEQKINNHKNLEETEKADLQLYITRCYGSLTTFNVLFKEEEDRFVGVKE